jgi:putative oxidoreductase
MNVDRIASHAGDGWLARLGPLDALYARVTTWLAPLALLALRLPVAVVFWRSGRTKVEGWNLFDVGPTQAFLFEHEFGMPFPAFTAQVTAIAEHVLPVMLVLGLATRVGAAGMLVMTAVIQLFVFPDAWFSDHMWWAVILFAVMALGPGKLSLDHLLSRALGPERTR